MNATSGYNDMTSYDFAHSGCAWCHPGGGAMEYDRDGYRFDGNALGSGLGVSGTNPEVANASDILTTTTRKGDYYVFDAATKTIAEPSTVINQGASSPQGTTTPTTSVYMKTWAQGGVAEADCLMCHLDGQYANLERAFAFPGATAPKLAASLGLAGARGETGFISGTGATPFAKATATSNPTNIANTNWKWDYNDVTADVLKTPKRENCTICHFPDKSWWKNCGTDTWTGYAPTDSNCGPASKPFGATMFQKLMGAGSTVDGDILKVGGVEQTNTAAWKIAKGRVEGGKRGESINDSANPDAHMKTAGTGMSCVDCHDTLEGTFGALLDANSNVIQPAMTVSKIDHQFAKGNNAPDGKNMDQLDNTTTCSGCHIEKTHPNLTENGGALVAPTPTHTGFPSIHLTKIDCKTCHIPVLNGPVKQFVADFTAGPFQTFERTQTLESAPGVNMKPLYMWRATEHDGTGMQIEPIMTMAVPVWANRVVDGTTGAVSYNPTYQRAAKMAAEKYRSLSGDNGTKYNFSLNTLVGYTTDGTTARTATPPAPCPTANPTCAPVTFAVKGGAFVINTAAEIAGIADIYKNPSTYSMPSAFSAVGEPVINFYFNQFAVSHDVATKASGNILGSTTNGAAGCNMCHSTSGATGSVGFFDKTFTLFAKPTDGLQQTFNVGGTATSIPRINMKFAAKKSDGTGFSIDLANVAEGVDVVNTLNQGEVLGYDSSRLAALKDLTNCAACHTDKSMSTLAHPTTAVVSSCTTCHTTQHQSALDVDVACGSCHGGSTGAGTTTNGAPYMSVTTLASYASVMHGGAPTGGPVSPDPVLPPSSGSCDGSLATTGTIIAVGGTGCAGDTCNIGVGGVVELGARATQTADAFVWWGDGAALEESAVSHTFSHTYNNIGKFQVILTVKNDCGFKAQKVMIVNVTGGTSGKGTLTITATGTDGRKVSYSVLNGSGVSITNGNITLDGSKSITLDAGTGYSVKFGYEAIITSDPVTYRTCNAATSDQATPVAASSAIAKCSHPAYATQTTCEAAGKVWQVTGQVLTPVAVTTGATTTVSLTNCN